MKKVLILAYDFPPYVSVGGLRPYSWYKHLKESGIEPIVVTRQWDNKYANELDYIAPSKSSETLIEETKYGTILRTAYKANLANRIMLKHGKNKYQLLRKIISAYFELMQWFLLIGPKVNLFTKANKYLKNNNVDVIIATGDPFILFRYASILSKKYNTPWIADYRDPWIQDKTLTANRFVKRLYAYFEKKYLKTSNSVITVSTFVQKQIESLLLDKEFYIIPNGYNNEAISFSRNSIQNNSVFSIAFTGTIYKWHPIKLFFQTLSQLIKENNIIFNINFYGINNDNEIRKLLEDISPNIVPFVNFTKKLSDKELFREMGKNNLFLLFNDYSILGTKIYNYLAVKRKILLCFSNDKNANNLKKEFYGIKELSSESQHLQEDLIINTNSGIIVNDQNHLIEALKNLHKEFKTKGYIECNSENIEQFSRKRQVERLAKIINSFEQESTSCDKN